MQKLVFAIILLIGCITSGLAIGARKSNTCQVYLPQNCQVLSSHFHYDSDWLANSHMEVDCKYGKNVVKKHLAKIEENPKKYRYLNNKIPNQFVFMKNKDREDTKVRLICPKLRNILKLN